jgi:hypothetical protein
MEDPLAEIVREMLQLLATSPGLAVGSPLKPELRELELQARRIVEYAQRRNATLPYAKMTCCGSVCLRPTDCRAEANEALAGPRAASLLMVAGAINTGLEQAAGIADRYLMEARHLGSGALFMGAHTAATQIGVSIRDLKQSYAGGVTPSRRT